MSKIKDTIEQQKEFRDKELEALESEYQYIDENKEHLHTLQGKPLLGTSTVVNVLSKPLTWWASGLAVEKFGWINSKKRVNGKYTTIDEKTRINAVLPQLEAIRNETPEQFLKRCDDAYKAHSVKLNDSADAGTDLHSELERYVKNKMVNGIVELSDYIEKTHPFILWAEENVKQWLWSEMNTYSKELWVGGISDAGCELNTGEYAIIDFKSSKEAYESQFIQIAGYAIQIEENGGFNKSGLKTFTLDKPITKYIVVPFGADKVEPIIRNNTQELQEGFRACVTLHKLTNK